MRRTLLVPFLLLLPLFVAAQTYVNDFEGQSALPWYNVNVETDSLGNHVYHCTTDNEYGLGFELPVTENLANKNIHLKYGFQCQFPSDTINGFIVVSVNKLWQGYPFSDYAKDSTRQFAVNVDLNLPADYLKDGTLKVYLWNPQHNSIIIDNAEMAITAEEMQCYLPENQHYTTSGEAIKPRSKFGHYSYFDDSQSIVLTDKNETPLTYPIYLENEFILNGDTMTTFSNQWTRNRSDNFTAIDDYCSTKMVFDESRNQIGIDIRSTFKQDVRLLRQAVVIPFIDSTLTVYRRNRHVDTTDFQNAYYLDREGFTIGEGERCVGTYHQTGISSIQLDARHHAAHFNTDYLRDHPLIHYPLDNDTSDYFIDISARAVKNGETIRSSFALSIGSDVRDLPQIMPVRDGFESGIVFTEHADWTDIRTQRTIMFGSENITAAKDAVGGFVHYRIPITKSVFYNNPDHVTNDEASHGLFKGPHATVSTDEAFYNLLKEIDGLGFEICLHTPEQYSTTHDNMAKALSFMKRHFNSPTWIDHGYNNGSQHNRENLVCDGLRPESPQYAAKLWKRNGVKYLWSAYYEENRMPQWLFDGNMMQPYGGYGDALPNRQITTLPDRNDFVLWSTPSTLEVLNNDEWHYFYAPERLQRLVDNHDVHITHIYPAWTNPDRAFWEYDDDSVAVAMPGFDFALQEIANLRDNRKMLPMTVRDYLQYCEALQQVEYVIIDSTHVELINHGAAIKGLTLISNRPIHPINKPQSLKESKYNYMIWFNMDRNEKTIIELR